MNRHYNTMERERPYKWIADCAALLQVAKTGNFDFFAPIKV